MRRSTHIASLRTARAARHSRSLRREMTDCEIRLWYHLRAGRFCGWKFRRQVPLGPYVVDFLCEKARLIVELDGGQHSERATHDAVRSEWLGRQGYAVLRFWNHDVVENMEGLLEVLGKELEGRRNGDPLPGPLPREREIL